jgi:hypothetical protein
MTDWRDDLTNRVRALEEQVKALCEFTGTPYRLAEKTPVPDDVLALIEQGKRIDAVKRYVELTGADLKTASKVIAEY